MCSLSKKHSILSKETIQYAFFSSPEHEVLGVSYCDHSPSVVRPSVARSHFLVYTLASTNINQSAPNLVHMYMAIRSRMSWIMELMGPELFELSALEIENLPYLQILSNQYQTWPQYIIEPKTAGVICP